MSNVFVLDASIAIKWFFLDEPQRDKALEVRSQLVEHPERFIIPILFHSEFIHVLARKSGNDIKFVQNALQVILSLGIRTVLLGSEGLEHAAKLSCSGLSGYDATYASLAVQSHAKWLTADTKAIKKVGQKWAIHL